MGRASKDARSILAIFCLITKVIQYKSPIKKDDSRPLMRN